MKFNTKKYKELMEDTEFNTRNYLHENRID